MHNGDNNDGDKGVTLEQILYQLKRQDNMLSTLDNKYDSLTNDWLKRSAKAEAINEGHRIEESLTNSFNRSLDQIKITFAVVGMLISVVIAILGWLGAEVFITKTVEHDLKNRINDTVKDIKQAAKEDISANAEKVINQINVLLKKSLNLHEEVSKVHKALGKNDLIVLQTDFGAESPYMGRLKGAIYHINPGARIDVITEEVPSFKTFDAAWILSNAIEFYPENTIFVSITGDPGNKLKSPVIARSKDKHHIFVGYSNGVFDIVKAQYGFDKTYVVDWNKLNKEWDNKGKSSPTEELIGTTDILGYLAASLSITSPPWSPEKEDFPWSSIAKSSDFPSEHKDVVAKSIETGNPDTVLIEGKIMHIDRYGNANTNVPKTYLDEQLQKKKLKLNRTTIMAVGISQDFDDLTKSDSNKELGLHEITFSTEYDAVKKGKPLVTIANGKLQLAINQGNLSKSDDLLIKGDNYTENNNERHVTTNMQVQFLIKKAPPLEYKILPLNPITIGGADNNIK